MKKSAFTLIELLVVIAIIAILAAILFPVFAQAKAAAKGAASISNSKQIGTAAFMYCGDYDDMLPVTVAWGTPGAPVSYGGRNYSPWSWISLPYMKSFDLFSDPLAPSGKVWNFAGIQKGIEKVIEPQYGYNNAYLSPYIQNVSSGFVGFQVQSQTTGADVANTVMFGSKFSSSEDNRATATINGWLGGPMDTLIIDPVKCTSELWPDASGVAYISCWDDWKRAGYWWTLLKNQTVPGGNTGGNATRSSGNSVVLWLDGHASKKSPGGLSAGTNWTPTIAVAPVINDRTKNVFSLTKL